MALQIEQDRQGAVCILALSGRLDTETATDLELAVQDLLGAGERHFVIDLAHIGYVSSAGLRVLLATAKQLDGGKDSLRLCCLNASVKQVFDVAGFAKLFSIYATRAAALDPHPQAKADSQLARKAAELIGAGAASAPADPKAVELARAAAQLLGAKPGAATPDAPKPKAATPPPPARAAVPRAQKPGVQNPEVRKPGLLGKLRGLFGGGK